MPYIHTYLQHAHKQTHTRTHTHVLYEYIICKYVDLCLMYVQLMYMHLVSDLHVQATIMLFDVLRKPQLLSWKTAARWAMLHVKVGIMMRGWAMLGHPFWLGWPVYGSL